MELYTNNTVPKAKPLVAGARQSLEMVVYDCGFPHEPIEVCTARTFRDVREPPENEAVPSVAVPAVISPLIDTAFALVNDPEASDAVPSMIVEELISVSGDKVPVRRRENRHRL